MNTIRYAPHVDGLRALAVLSVVLYHLNPTWVPGGFAGVDIFFVISGFIVSASIGSTRFDKTSRFITFFYARRVARIIPALSVFLLATFCLVVFLIPSAWISKSIDQTGLFAFFGLSNFILAHSGDTYFSPLSEFNPFTHTWSLAVEEQFYLLFPALFAPWIAGRFRLSSTLFLSVSVLSFIAAISSTNSAEQNYYFSWFRLWELGSGVALYQLLSMQGVSFSTAYPKARWTDLGSATSLLLLIFGLYTADPKSAPFPSAIPALLGTLGLLGFLQSCNYGFANSFLTLRFLRFVGKISYSLYLWHWAVFVFFRWTVGLHTEKLMLLAFGLSFLIAWLSYRFVETPFRRLASGKSPLIVISAGIAVLTVAFSASLYLIKARPSLSLSQVVQNDAVWYPDRIASNPDVADCNVVFTEEKIGDSTVWNYSRNPACQLPKTFEHEIYVIGDSHAMHYRRMFSLIALGTGANVHAFNNAGCPFIDFFSEPTRDNRCKAPTESGFNALVNSAKQGDLVLLGSLRVPRMIDQWAHLYTYNQVMDEMLSRKNLSIRSLLEKEAIKDLAPLALKGVRLVFLAPTPTFNTVPFRCADWFNAMNPICSYGPEFSRNDLLRLREPAMTSLATVIKNTPNTSVWDPFPILCPADSINCRTANDGMPLFFDGDHISGHANDLLFEHFRNDVLKSSDKN